MSHIATYTSTVGIVNIDLIKKALEILSLTGELELRDYVEDYSRAKLKTWDGMDIIGALYHKTSLSRGIGVAINKKGQLVFVGEVSGSVDFGKVQSMIEQTYKVAALITALQEMGYEVAMVEGGKNKTAFEANLGGKEITVGVGIKGEIITDFDGFSGKSCLQTAEELVEEAKEMGVNVQVQDFQLKPESRIEPSERQRLEGKN